MNVIQSFNFNTTSPVRAFEKGGLTWFVAADVCKALEIQNPTQALEKLDDDERSMFNIGRSEIHGGGGNVNIINESGLYILILRSRKAMEQGSTAWKFRKWVTSEVLPTIRKTGGYQIGQKTTADDRTGLRQAVAALVGRKGIDYSSAYSMIHQRFNVEAIEDIPAEKLPEAVAYAHALTLHTGLTGEVLDALPKAEPKLPIDGNSLADIAAMVYYGTWMIELGKDVSAPLRQLGCKQAVTMWTVWHETRSRLKRTVAALEVLRGYADKDTSDRIAVCLEGIYSKAAVR
ncbi:BRO-N domain-containing protein [Neisseria sicca]|uniref:BRO-N domain-containing protein n=1 Tax=Neisseria sicca TaxID=490 RepID=UPI003FA0F0A0